MAEELTQEEMEALKEMGYGYPQEEEKANIFSFFKRIISAKDTTKTANLINDELGIAKVPVRTSLTLSLYAKEMGLSGLGDYFFKEAQIITDSSLSREGFLDKLAVTQKREIDSSNRKPPKPKQKSWFGSKKQEQPAYE